MFSETPGTPGRRQQIPRTLRSIAHPRLRGLVKRPDAGGIDQRVHLQRDPRLFAGFVRRDGRGDLLEDAVAHRRRRDQHLAVLGRAAVAGEEVEHLGDVGADPLVGGEEAEVGVEAGRLGVVVAGADMDVLAHPIALAAGDQDRLDVRLQAGDAVDDVDAGLLQRLGPVDVGLLVEAGLQLDHADRLLAAFGGADQRGTRGESSLVRYTVCLIASTSGSATACSTKRSTEVANDS